jgi:DNA-binding NarL/FixJ family response regulator
MLGVKTMTKRAREMLLPANCPCFELSDAPIPERVIEVPRKAPEERVEQIRELHAQGLYDREIAAKMGISDRTVGTWRKSLGLESNYKSRNGGDQK